MFKKVLSLFLLGAVLLSLIACGGDNPGKFVKSPSGNEGYLLKDNSYAKDMWVTHGGKEYYFDDNGDLVKSTRVGSYYVDEKGVKIKAKGEYCIIKCLYDDYLGENVYYIVGKDGRLMREGPGNKNKIENYGSFREEVYEFNRKGETLYNYDGVVFKKYEDGMIYYRNISIIDPDYEVTTS